MRGVGIWTMTVSSMVAGTKGAYPSADDRKIGQFLKCFIKTRDYYDEKFVAAAPR
ncbi:hypothetical protein [Belnapia moabensis]|uniref:hypothetical protein n=1 Tax=Belnapia moabensis TaxID=365533 RepID=UPI0012ED4736|nr:hypothetical protein [Belnapia moabensis]